MKKRVLSPVGRQRVRLGRKVISSARVYQTIEARGGVSRTNERKRKFRVPSYRPTKLHAGIACASLVIAIGAVTGYGVIAQRQADERAKAEEVRIQKQRVADQKSANCRADIVKSKSEQLGRATYDELYGNSC